MLKLRILTLLLCLIAIGAQGQSFFKRRHRYYRPYISRAITGAVDQQIPRAHGDKMFKAYQVQEVAQYERPTKSDILRSIESNRRDQARAAHIANLLSVKKMMFEQAFLGSALAMHEVNWRHSGR